ncbi:dihydrolipoyl dehydrogenase [Caldinitratiruptor microaerophilus]|nr:dihydrolipoyl dehydrogenase [Caldinitratiruptor microaerophilus]
MGSLRTRTEVLIIGGGTGGYIAAEHAAKLGKEVTLVEADKLGGTCLHHGCIPSKALISSADLVHRLRAAEDRGIVAAEIRVDGRKLQEWKQKVLNRLESGIKTLMKGADVNVVHGRARLTGPREAVVEGPDGVQTFTFEQCIVATGSVAAGLPHLPFDGERVLDAAAALDLAEPPGRLVVVGGGYIGLELGILYRKLGSEVTVVEATGQLLPGTDPDLVNVLMRKLRRLGVTVHRNARAGTLTDAGLEVQLEDGRAEVLPADKVLVAVGRRPNTEGLGLEAAGVALDERGFVRVDEQCRTRVPHIFAIGDVAGGPLLAHKAGHQGRVAAEVIAGRPSACDWAAVPAVVFTDPEIAWAGLSESEARERGYEVAVGKFLYTASGRALTLGETDGLVKVVADRNTGLVLGIHLCGPEVSELAAEATLALEMGAVVEDLASTIHPHPTLSEGIAEASLALAREAMAAAAREVARAR